MQAFPLPRSTAPQQASTRVLARGTSTATVAGHRGARARLAGGTRPSDTGDDSIALVALRPSTLAERAEDCLAAGNAHAAKCAALACIEAGSGAEFHARAWAVIRALAGV